MAEAVLPAPGAAPPAAPAGHQGAVGRPEHGGGLHEPAPPAEDPGALGGRVPARGPQGAGGPGAAARPAGAVGIAAAGAALHPAAQGPGGPRPGRPPMDGPAGAGPDRAEVGGQPERVAPVPAVPRVRPLPPEGAPGLRAAPSGATGRVRRGPGKKKVAQPPADGALLAMDEFALQSVPDTHYAWAGRNTAPSVLSDER